MNSVIINKTNFWMAILDLQDLKNTMKKKKISNDNNFQHNNPDTR